jgi:hypothetical protein
MVFSVMFPSPEYMYLIYHKRGISAIPVIPGVCINFSGDHKTTRNFVRMMTFRRTILSNHSDKCY